MELVVASLYAKIRHRRVSIKCSKLSGRRFLKSLNAAQEHHTIDIMRKNTIRIYLVEYFFFICQSQGAVQVRSSWSLLKTIEYSNFILLARARVCMLVL